MALNGTDLINHPWNTTFKAFTDLFGSAFYVIPLSFITVALYMKTRNTVAVSAFMLGSGAMLSSANMFSGVPEMMFVYLIFSILGLIGLVISLFFMKK